ncbi:uncharacterized protein [Aristolochia californica]|uniref:uncharacterized protein n=1 Tax=Aristolochia californica TaxID=171875 RepID=UPI0035DD91FF
MRIRRHAKLASVSPPFGLPTWVKNQLSSPHEETAFLSQSQPKEHQGSCEAVDKKLSVEESNPESVDLNASSVVETTKEDEEEKHENERAKSCKRKAENYEKQIIYCRKKSTNGWKCKREAKRGHSLCDHHLKQRRAYHYEPRRKPNRTAGILDPSFVLFLPSSDFYYYAGFAPLVRRKRRGSEATEEAVIMPSLSSSSGDGDHSRAHDRDDDPSDADPEKKRGRKPMKSRSLKSL